MPLSGDTVRCGEKRRSRRPEDATSISVHRNRIQFVASDRDVPHTAMQYCKLHVSHIIKVISE